MTTRYFIRTCDICHENEADLRFREVTGWEQVRDQGGANKIIARKETARRICERCLDDLKNHRPPGQGRFL